MLNISPTLAKFTELARTRRVISVHTRLLADHLTAIGLYATLCGTREGTFLLESASEGVWSRYSFVGVHSAATLTECGGKAVWLGRELTGIGDGDPVSVLPADADGTGHAPLLKACPHSMPEWSATWGTTSRGGWRRCQTPALTISGFLNW